jgi:hypothetical protein
MNSAATRSLHRHACFKAIDDLPRRDARKSFAGIFLLGACFPNLAGATCGLAFCMVNTNWNLQGMVAEPGLRLDTRFEFIDQDQPRAGSKKVGVGEIPKHHDEVRTINRNLVTTLDYTFDSNWGVTAVVPVVNVDHRHIHNHRGTPIPETWDFTRLGDIRVMGRFQRAIANIESGRPSFFGINLGLKLPTGERDFTNGDGALAERSLQPGSGTTDLLVGGSFSQVLVDSGSSWFVQALAQTPLNSRNDYRPGNRYTLDVGYRYEATEKVGLMLQVNALLRRRDRGAQAEPEESGGRFVHVSPGISYAFSRSTQVYGFVQVPVYQHVNGVQLTADWGAVVGFTTRF